MKIVKTLVRKMYEEANEHQREENEIWITDLCRCPMKIKFETEIPELKRNFLPIYVVGNLVHYGLQSILREEFNAEIEVKREKVLDNYKITGKIDALINDTGIEIKFSQSDEFIPYEHHILQCKLYNWLFELKKTILIYITPQRIAEFEIEDRMTDNHVMNLINNTNIPRFKWECKYCEYDMICPYKVK